MNLNQEFHQHLQAGRLTEAISLIVGQLVELKIITKANSGQLHTTVDLLNGQITNTVDPAFFSDKASQKLLEFHTNQIAATSQVVREQLRSLQDLLQVLTPSAVASTPLTAPAGESNPVPDQPLIDPLHSLIAAPAIVSPQTSETLPVTLTEAAPVAPKFDEALVPEKNTVAQPVSLVAKTAEQSIAQPQTENDQQISEPAEDLDIPAASAAPQPENRSERVKLPAPAAKESRVGIASGLVAALAQTSALDPSEAATIPNKFDQALRSAGVRSTTEKDADPFTTKPIVEPIVISQPVIKQPTEPLTAEQLIEQPTEIIPRQELIDLLRESEDDWDEWLLEEDNIFSELTDVTKDKMPDLESNWLSANASPVKSSPADWEEFMPEYPEISTVASKNQANVERFRQNLVNDPQLMSELLAELDDLEGIQDNNSKL